MPRDGEVRAKLTSSESLVPAPGDDHRPPAGSALRASSSSSLEWALAGEGPGSLEPGGSVAPGVGHVELPRGKLTSVSLYPGGTFHTCILYLGQVLFFVPSKGRGGDELVMGLIYRRSTHVGSGFGVGRVGKVGGASTPSADGGPPDLDGGGAETAGSGNRAMSKESGRVGSRDWAEEQKTICSATPASRRGWVIGWGRRGILCVCVCVCVCLCVSARGCNAVSSRCAVSAAGEFRMGGRGKGRRKITNFPAAARWIS